MFVNTTMPKEGTEGDYDGSGQLMLSGTTVNMTKFFG
jgi:hypothetical protein